MAALKSNHLDEKPTKRPTQASISPPHHKQTPYVYGEVGGERPISPSMSKEGRQLEGGFLFVSDGKLSAGPPRKKICWAGSGKRPVRGGAGGPRGSFPFSNRGQLVVVFCVRELVRTHHFVVPHSHSPQVRGIYPGVAGRCVRGQSAFAHLVGQSETCLIMREMESPKK